MKSIGCYTLLLALWLTGCSNRDSESVAVFGEHYNLRRDGLAHRVDLSKVQFEGYCDEKERNGIADCLGRIPISNLFVKRVIVVWPEQRLAAKVILDRGEYLRTSLYLTQDKAGIWHIRGSHGVLVDSYEEGTDQR